MSATDEILSIIKTHPQYVSFENKANKELQTIRDIDTMSDGSPLSSYLLVKYKQIQSNKEQPGDSNEPNSVIAYLMGITTKQPSQEFNLEKRRAYGRAGFPDIDMDFDYLRRSEVIDYFKEKYGGANHVAHIGTIQTLQVKAALRRAIKVLDPTNSIKFDENGKEIKGENNDNFALENQILKTLPRLMKNKKTGELIKTVKDTYAYYTKPIYRDQRSFREWMDEYPRVCDVASRVEGIISSTGVHAAGLVASPLPLSSICPLHTTGRKGPSQDIATQFTAEFVESLGLIKFDFLGLKTKTAINWASQWIKESYGVDIDWNVINLDDKPTLSLLNSGETDGCFQFEEEGMQAAAREIGIDSFEDIVITVAMFRPGPMDYIPELAARKRGKIKVSYPHESMQKITKNTYGIICFQEDTLVSMADGTEKPIKKVKAGDLVHSVDLNTGKVVERECCGCGPTRSGNGLLITLENGYQLIVTPDHKILTYYGMKEAQKLEIGKDIVACPLHTPIQEKQAQHLASWLGTDEHIAYLLGQLTGDGNVGVSCSLSCGLKDPCDLVEEWIINNLPKIKVHKYFHGSWHLGISCPDLYDPCNKPFIFNDHISREVLSSPVVYGNRKTKFHVLLEDMGLKANCYNKKVPDQILKSGVRIRCAYLAGLFDSDGSIILSNNGIAVCHYTSQSPELINSARKLLQSLGISHQVRHNRIHVWDTEILRHYIDEFLVVRSFPENLTTGKYSSRFPSAELRNLKKKLNISGREFASKYKISRSALLPKKNFVCFGTAEKCGFDIGNLRYYHIASIDRVPDQKFWGISVYEHHNLVANGIVAKNCFQEQVMRVFMAMSGLTATDGYKFTKGCAKKKKKLIEQYQEMFIAGCTKNNIDKNVINKVWSDLIKFSGYAFNKAHSVSYAFEAFKTAYLKAHYPIEFFAARLSVETFDRKFEKVDKYLSDAKKFGFNVLPPNINESKLMWSIVNNKTLRQPILLKDVGPKVAEAIVAGQPYAGNDLLYAFVRKVGDCINARAMEAMYDAGLWDDIGLKKNDLLEKFDKIKKDKKRGDTGMDIFD